MAPTTIDLKLVNRSRTGDGTAFVIFQKNVASSFVELAVAWRVIRHLGTGDYHPFTYPQELTVSAADSWGNYTPQLPAYEGEAFDMVRASSGDVLQRSASPAPAAREIAVRNELPSGAISANVYRDGKLLATKTNVAPGQKADFAFEPRLYVGAVSQLEEGQVLSSAIVEQIGTELNLVGIRSAEVVVTGGGAGPSAAPFEFTLANVD